MRAAYLPRTQVGAVAIPAPADDSALAVRSGGSAEEAVAGADRPAITPVSVGKGTKTIPVGGITAVPVKPAGWLVSGDSGIR
ncbi:MAG: hypothetical protein ACRDQU_02390 [Pseudonocardiaceae bacterium]